MRTLVLNIGNTSLFGAVFAGTKPGRIFRKPKGEIAALGAWLRAAGPVERVALCSVVPMLTGRIAKLIAKETGVEPVVLTAGAAHGLKIGYDDPRELGADRLAAALGARGMFPKKNVIVVDAGTATTVTALGRDGTLHGGAIFPGLGLWPAMLATRTAQLPEVKLGRPSAALGRGTRAGLQSGIFYGHAGAIREVVRRMRAEAFGRAAVIVVGTGGHARRFADEGIFEVIVPDLVLRGLNDFVLRDDAARL